MKMASPGCKVQFPEGEKERVMEDRRGFWAVVLGPIVVSIVMAVPARADFLVHRLNGQAQAAGTSHCVADACAAVAEEKTNQSTVWADASHLPLLVLTTVMFSNPDDTTPGGSTSGGTTTGTSGGGSNPPPGAHAPEPATVISALLGIGLAGMYTVFRRKRLVSPAH
jgi:hypothetical protein